MTTLPQSGLFSHRRRRRRKKTDWFAYALWVVVGCAAVVAASRYVLGDLVIDLEVVFEQQILRLLLPIPCAIGAIYALVKSNYQLAGGSALVFLCLGVEACVEVRLAPSLPASVHARADVRVLTQNVGPYASPETWEAWLREHPADLVFLQEIYQPNREAWEGMAARFGYETTFRMLRSDAGMGGMSLSRFPLEPMESIAVPSVRGEDRHLVRARVNCRGTYIDVFGIHLESVHTEGGKREWFGSSPLRLAQATILAEIVKRSENPVIVAGDFNAAPTYRSIRALRGELEDAWEEAGWGLGGTYPSAFPLARIDAILYRGLLADRARIGPKSESDHLGVCAVLNLVGTAPGLAE